MKTAAGASIHNSHRTHSAASPSVPPLHGHTGLAALPALIPQPGNNFPYIMPGLTFSLPAAAEFPTRHGRRWGVSLSAFIPRGTEAPKPPGGLCAHHHPPHHLTPTPKAAGTYLHGGQGWGGPGLSWRVPAVSPRLAALPGRCRLPWQDSRLGKAAKFWGGERRRRSLSQTPLGLAPCPRSDPGAIPERSRGVPGAIPERSPRVPGALPARRDGGAGSAGIADSGNLPELFTAPSEPSSQGCNAKPPSRPRAGIFTRLQPHTLPVP